MSNWSPPLVCRNCGVGGPGHWRLYVQDVETQGAAQGAHVRAWHANHTACITALKAQAACAAVMQDQRLALALRVLEKALTVIRGDHNLRPFAVALRAEAEGRGDANI